MRLPDCSFRAVGLVRQESGLQVGDASGGAQQEQRSHAERRLPGGRLTALVALGLPPSRHLAGILHTYVVVPPGQPDKGGSDEAGVLSGDRHI